MSRFRVYAQLVRLPNLPTALADICLAGLALGTVPREGAFPWLAWLLLLPASACLYCAGMVWNDYFDLEQDRRERPFRPLPSGRITLGQAARCGSSLMLVGVIFALLASRTSFVIACALVVAILLYDRILKRTWAGPLGMGLCRFLNILLGTSADGHWAEAWKIHLALIVGGYIVGVTWFARTEARQSTRISLQGAAVVMLVSLFLALPLPLQRQPPVSSFLFPYLLVVLAFLIGSPVWQAIRNPSPGQVQNAVKRSLMGLILLDSVLATALAGSVGLLVLVLLIPSLFLNWQKWLYAT